MSTMVITGCSYANIYATVANNLSDRLGYDELVNLSQDGTSIYRAMRSTLNYVLEGHECDFLLMFLTFSIRFEAPWAKVTDYLDGPWLSYSTAGLDPACLARNGRHLNVDKDAASAYIKHKISCDWSGEYNDRVLTDLLFFTGWLEQQNINYCILGACDMHYDHESILPSKKHAIINNPRIIDIFNWSSNKFLSENGARGYSAEDHLDPLIKHYNPATSHALTDFLYDYISKNCL